MNHLRLTLLLVNTYFLFLVVPLGAASESTTQQSEQKKLCKKTARHITTLHGVFFSAYEIDALQSALTQCYVSLTEYNTWHEKAVKATRFNTQKRGSHYLPIVWRPIEQSSEYKDLMAKYEASKEKVRSLCVQLQLPFTTTTEYQYLIKKIADAAYIKEDFADDACRYGIEMGGEGAWEASLLKFIRFLINIYPTGYAGKPDLAKIMAKWSKSEPEVETVRCDRSRIVYMSATHLLGDSDTEEQEAKASSAFSDWLSGDFVVQDEEDQDDEVISIAEIMRLQAAGEYQKSVLALMQGR